MAFLLGLEKRVKKKIFKNKYDRKILFHSHIFNHFKSVKKIEKRPARNLIFFQVKKLDVKKHFCAFHFSFELINDFMLCCRHTFN